MTQNTAHSTSVNTIIHYLKQKPNENVIHIANVAHTYDDAELRYYLSPVERDDYLPCFNQDRNIRYLPTNNRFVIRAIIEEPSKCIESIKDVTTSTKTVTEEQLKELLRMSLVRGVTFYMDNNLSYRIA